MAILKIENYTLFSEKVKFHDLCIKVLNNLLRNFIRSSIFAYTIYIGR